MLGGPFDFDALGGELRVVNEVALACATLGVVVAAGSLVVRFRRAPGVERQQLRWVALAAALLVPAAVAVLAGLAQDSTAAVTWAVSAWAAAIPLAIGAAVLRYRLYDPDRIVSRTLAYGLLTVLLGGGYAGVVLGLGQLLGRDSSLVVAVATLAVAAAFQPARRRIQQNAELLSVVDQAMQPTQVTLWLRPSHAASGAPGGPAAHRRSSRGEWKSGGGGGRRRGGRTAAPARGGACCPTAPSAGPS